MIYCRKITTFRHTTNIVHIHRLILVNVDYKCKVSRRFPNYTVRLNLVWFVIIFRYSFLFIFNNKRKECVKK